MIDLQLSSYDYHLPPNLIATFPAMPRESAKLLVYDRQKDTITHSDFFHFYDFVPSDTLFVLNDTKVIKARMYGNKIHADHTLGGQVEVFYHRHIAHHQFLVQIKGRVKVGQTISLSPNLTLQVQELLEDGFRIVSFELDSRPISPSELLCEIEKIGHIPLPPYIKRQDRPLDAQEYQSVFAKNLGSVAAPTASLHFSQIDQILQHFKHCFVTLNVGAGTFLSVQTPDIRDHQIHTESFALSNESYRNITQASHILCIGTTTARVVEYLHRNPPTHTTQSHIYGECDLFLHPHNPPQKINALLTNFHLPKSTLIMLVSSLVGRKKCLEIYQEAIQAQYRFYSYGDGMLIL
ncbi:tRNA preQ1(34) S-adenosylmethionine ribosyltransferase-isomerase QueA [Helicobacter enhydrae]|uniref:S-adenosylmethionine:tRNA ribosyltransferase-isomerase n=1 Tax=Helicobacter enhydrae TaxID=222136 RepID=A0A1B1U5B7_9HELI|nr:tRNA preQ1(34) S-adenosylmethionine ribosyltransferase-isomerase QueA [Helicobacter enhydrae]ANV97950.1 tRNA preQ1(34) S-adenosylmethionine ribosyltransferase-isomerase QueA [Helicobacter enhydrae]